VADHPEPTARQDALAERAVLLGWPRGQGAVSDDDLGKRGPSIAGRPGCQRLRAAVALDRVGLVRGLEMSRRARSCRDGHQLLERWARFRVLLADADGRYDPNEYADRLLLGLTGMRNEAELHGLTGRMHQGKLNKARRGGPVVAAPAGYVQPPSGQVPFDPDAQAQTVIRLLFAAFDRQGTVPGVLRYLIANGVKLPVRSRAGADRGQLQWHPPCRGTIRHILRHPRYAGAERYGYRPTDARRQTPGHPKSGRGSGRAAADCRVFWEDRFPAYIRWERFEANQLRLAANRSRAESAGAVRRGAALRAGVVWCGRWGRRMYVRYGRTGQRAASVCRRQRSDYGLPLCQSTSAEAVATWLAEPILAALQPAALAASLTAATEVEQRRREQTRHREQRLERARFEADRAGRQYHACGPENRLVARALERRWDEALREVQRLEAEFARFTRAGPRLRGQAEREQIRRLAAGVPALGHAPSTTAADRRQSARLLRERVVLTTDPASDAVGIGAEWAGGAVRAQTLRRAVRSSKDPREWPQLSARLAVLHGGGPTPDQIAAALDPDGFRPPKRATRFTAGMVRRLAGRTRVASPHAPVYVVGGPAGCRRAVAERAGR
jgi:DNA invertase Pin-like site-specific DNA recombinase